jgi:hypothetical protein
VINLDDLLSEMPPPDPVTIFTKSEWEAEAQDDLVAVPELQTDTQPSIVVDEEQPKRFFQIWSCHGKKKAVKPGPWQHSKWPSQSPNHGLPTALKIRPN